METSGKRVETNKRSSAKINTHKMQFFSTRENKNPQTSTLKVLLTDKSGKNTMKTGPNKKKQF